MRRRRGGIAWWLIFLIGVLYFVLPLYATLVFSLKAKPFLSAYTSAFSDPKFIESLGYSMVVGIVTIFASLALIVPTAYWVQLRVPRARSLVEFVTLLPFVIPAVVLVFGLIRVYSRPPLPLTHTDLGSTFLLVAGYVVLSLPYMYRAVDAGLRAIDIRSLTEAAQSMGAGWFTIIVRIILPTCACPERHLLTLAIVLGEFTIASFLARPAFGPYLNLLADTRCTSSPRSRSSASG
jgi:putative spermidine/putrescine transport system permease protein